MSHHEIIQEPNSRKSIFTLMPDEYVRFEYMYKPGCCCFSSKLTTVTNKRLYTRTIKTPSILSCKTSSGPEKETIIFLNDVTNVKQLKSAIPSVQISWWIRCFNLLTCSCSHDDIEWLELCHSTENFNSNMTNPTPRTVNVQDISLMEKF